MKSKRAWLWVGLAFVLGLVIMGGIAALLTNIQTRKAEAVEYPLKTVEIANRELDPAVWGQNFPRQYDTFKKTEIDTNETPFGGSVPLDKLERYPILKRVWAGYAFSVDFNEERGHFWALTDQKETERQEVVKQPGACANCHAAEAPLLIEDMGWEAFNSTPYKELESQLHMGSTCRDCHNPDTMELWISRPAFKNAMEARGVDLSKATRQEMRTYVCAQCHVEYYFKGEKKELVFPWEKGLQIENINEYYDEYGFKDWAHKETGAPMLKMQHPEFEMFSTSLHYRSGVACADCHMPYVRDGSVKVSDHWLRSPLDNVNAACGTCHKQDEQALKDRILIIQNNTAQLLRTTEGALEAAIDALAKAKAAGLTDEQLKEAQNFHRQASMRYDFVMSENSTGFHSPQEAARVLGNAIDLARQAQIAAERLMAPAQPTAQK
ncbi:MAG: ammonia-forming cytochrome c nitrite reductase subunit c552 [Anaerolineae bacterium]|jgi:nitrite reductase (cytochrome c-552)|nr:ammonia-forming cytochrome c nitrite reductase subunit c552 [Anaerolineae bacterium]